MVAPAVFAWWSGRQLVRRRDDPALAERMLARQQQFQQVLLLSCIPLAFAAGTYYWFAVLGLQVVAWIADYPSRRVLLEERWALPTYLVWFARFNLAWLGFWFALLLAPTVVHAAGAWRWPVAGLLAILLALWAHGYARVFFWLVRARPMAPPAEWQPVLDRAQTSRPRLAAMPVPGGRFVNAFAFPGIRDSRVLFSEPLLELLSVREQAAILGHELAHLEHHDRRRQRHAAAAVYTLVALATLGAALGLVWLGSGTLVTAWSFALLIGFAMRTSRQKTHETESDQRALALCGDADALVSGLTKLTIAGRMPRRWSAELEKHASHPSLARRLHAIRRVAGLVSAPAPSVDALIASTTQRGALVILDERGVSGLSGVADATPKDPALLRQAATSSWSVPYAEVVELRVAASWWGGASLRVRDRAGTSRSVRIAADDVQALQQRLDEVETRLPHDAPLTEPPAVVGRLTALALWLASVGTLLPLGVIVGLIGLVRPSRAALAAIAGTAGACVLIMFGDLADGNHHWTRAAMGAGAAVVGALAAWLATRPRTFDWRKADYLPVLIATGSVVAVTWGTVGIELVWTRTFSTLLDALHRAPVLWAGLVALGGALATAPRRSLRYAGVATVTVAILLNLGVRIADLVALSRVVAQATDGQPMLPRLARFELPPQAHSLRVSPLGTRFAVATRHSPRDAALRFVVLDAAGGRTEIDGRDLHFVDESNALLVTDGHDGATLQHVELSGRAEVLRGWRVDVGGVTGLRVASVRGSGWAGLGYDARTEEVVGVIGRVGSAELRRQRLAGGDDEAFTAMALSPTGRGLRAVSGLAPLARLPWAGLLYSGGLPRESRVWRSDGNGEQMLATLPAHADCHLVGRDVATVVCVGTDRGRTLVWRFDLGSSPTAPLIIPGRALRSGVSRDGRLVALLAGDELLMVDLDFARARRWTIPPGTAYPIDVVPAGDRLVTLSYSRTGPSIEVYDARW